tara:strand:+ start:33139 stop:33852 length:714 start_codon:yes stop_codon:yes gene_type:complete
MFKPDFFMNLRTRQDGNVLFLIFIVVALFAALSYAVTSSIHFYGDDYSEADIISSNQVTQYPAIVNTAVVSMIIAGTKVEDLRFNPPNELSKLKSVNVGVFHPEGGAAKYVQGPADVMVSGNPGDWTFNADLEISDIGSEGVGGNDIIAYLVGIKGRICSKINAQYGMGSIIPVLDGDRSGEYTARMNDDGISDYMMPTDDVPDIDDGEGVFDGQPFGCFQNADGGDYVYYHVILER